MREGKIKVLFAAAEAAPFIKTGGLGDVIGSLPQAVSDKTYDVSVVLPLHEGISDEFREKMTYVTNVNVSLSWRKQSFGMFKYEQNGVTWYFLDNEYYFKRGETLYGCYDDAERYAFFSMAVLEALPHLNGFPDIIHCHDWHTALIPIYLRLKYWDRTSYQRVKTVFTIHNIEYQGVFGREIVENVLGLSQEEYENGFLEHDGDVNFMKAAILSSDVVTTVSPTYSEEIKTSEYGQGLDSILRSESAKLVGILNGIDGKLYNPKKDKKLFSSFSKEDLLGKAKNKEELQRLLNLPQRAEVPLIGMVTRLVSHKGIDLVTAVIDELLSEDIQMVIVGTGEWKYEEFLCDKQWQYPNKLSVNIAFNLSLAGKVYGASDMFLMPSKSEPCGLAQMIALRYGTIPIVRETGGLRDSIQPYNKFTGEGNGFSFKEYNAHDMLHVVREACSLYRDEKGWAGIIESGMSSDFSWKNSAKKYKKVYLELLN